MNIVDELRLFLRKHENKNLYDNFSKKEIKIKFNSLDKFNPKITDLLIEDPEKIFDYFDEALKDFDIPEKTDIRIIDIPDHIHKRIRMLRTKDKGKLICVEGIVKSATEVMPQLTKSYYECKECGAIIEIEHDEYELKPNFCECGSKSLKLINEEEIDIRWITINEPFEIAEGEKPGEIKVFLKKNLTTPDYQRKTDPGNRLKIVGVLREQRQNTRGRNKLTRNLFIEANSVEYSDKEFENIEVTKNDKIEIEKLASDPNIYERLVNTIAPGIYGYEEIKQAIALQMFGGCDHTSPDGTKTRGNIHILLIGDPGVAKSQLLRLVSNITPRGKYVSGKGVTGAGLTATVRRDEETNNWVLEAGALVLANKGLLAIDEFDKIDSENQSSLHEAMSIESISLAKASITASLPAKTAILGAANPKFGRFDPMKSKFEQITLTDTILSRFDLKFPMFDVPDKKRDEAITNHIFKSRKSNLLPNIDITLLKKYVAYAKNKCQYITISDEAEALMKKFFVDIRKTITESIPITPRQLEAIIRLSQASAKIRLSNVVTKEDAKRAIDIMKYSLNQLSRDENGELDIDVLESNISTRKRDTFTKMMDIMNNELIYIDDLYALAEEMGVSNPDKVIEDLKRNGYIMEPKPGYYKKI